MQPALQPAREASSQSAIRRQAKYAVSDRYWQSQYAAGRSYLLWQIRRAFFCFLWGSKGDRDGRPYFPPASLPADEGVRGIARG